MPQLEDMHHHRNYHRLEESLHTAMDECIRSNPVYLRIEARYDTNVCLSVHCNGQIWHCMNKRVNCRHTPKNISDQLGILDYAASMQLMLG